MTDHDARLPASAPPRLNSNATFSLQQVLNANANDLVAALEASPMNPTAIAYRLGMFRALGYFVPAMTQEQRDMRLLKFVSALDGVPAPFTAGSFDDWFDGKTRPPTPADIKLEALTLIRRARERIRWLNPPTPAQPPAPLTPKEAKRRKEFLRELAADFPEFFRGLKNE